MTSGDRMFELAQHFWLPWTLLLNFSIFQYLVTVYFNRRHEPRVILVLLSAFLGFSSLTLFSFADETFVNKMDDISETCCVLTSLIQITIVGRDVTRKVKFRSLKWMTRVAELFILMGFCVILVNVLADLAPPDVIDFGALDMLDNLVENLSLVFIFVFRFYYLSLSQGFGKMLRTHKLEILTYALFVTHEYPFLVLEYTTKVSWEYVQAVYMRVLIIACLALTIRDKIQSSRHGEKYEVVANASKDRRRSSCKPTQPRKVIGVKSDRRSSILRPNVIYVVMPAADD